MEVELQEQSEHISQAVAAAKQAKQQSVAEHTEWNMAKIDLSDRLRILSDALVSESLEWSSGHAQSTRLAQDAICTTKKDEEKRCEAQQQGQRQIQELVEALRKECQDRELGDCSVLAELSRFQSELRDECVAQLCHTTRPPNGNTDSVGRTTR